MHLTAAHIVRVSGRHSGCGLFGFDDIHDLRNLTVWTSTVEWLFENGRIGSVWDATQSTFVTYVIHSKLSEGERTLWGEVTGATSSGGGDAAAAVPDNMKKYLAVQNQVKTLTFKQIHGKPWVRRFADGAPRPFMRGLHGHFKFTVQEALFTRALDVSTEHGAMVKELARTLPVSSEGEYQEVCPKLRLRTLQPDRAVQRAIVAA